MQKQPRTSAQIEAVKRLQTTRRARRGLVAGYIHELSGRHADDNRRNVGRRASQRWPASSAPAQIGGPLAGAQLTEQEALALLS